MVLTQQQGLFGGLSQVQWEINCVWPSWASNQRSSQRGSFLHPLGEPPSGRFAVMGTDFNGSYLQEISGGNLLRVGEPLAGGVVSSCSIPAADADWLPEAAGPVPLPQAAQAVPHGSPAHHRVPGALPGLPGPSGFPPPPLGCAHRPGLRPGHDRPQALQAPPWGGKYRGGETETRTGEECTLLRHVLLGSVVKGKNKKNNN